MSTSGVSEGGFSGRSGFVLRYTISRQSVSGSTSVWHVELHAINRSGFLSYDLSSRPWAISGTSSSSGSWVPDFRNGDDILLFAANYTYTNPGTISWSASAGPAGIFGTASTSGSFTADSQSDPATTPSAPPAPTIEAKTSSSLTFNFAPPSDNGGHAIQDYIAQLDRSPSFVNPYQRIISKFSLSPQTFTGLEPYTEYSVRYAARNDLGRGTWSPIYTSITFAAPPSVPRSLAVSNIGPSSLTLTWTAPADNNGAAVSGYRIIRATNPEFTADVTQFDQGTTTNKTFTDLQPGTTYYFKVSAKNSTGNGSAATIDASTVAGVYVSTGTSWKGAGVYVSDGTTWKLATLAASQAGVWVPAD